MEIRKATMADIDLLIKLRMDFIADSSMPSIEENVRTQIGSQLADYYAEHIEDGTFIAVLAETENTVACVAFLTVTQMPANPYTITGRLGTVLNVFTYPACRRQGIATKVMKRILQEAKKAKVSLVRLSATKAGQPLYESLGFTPSSELGMSIVL